MAINRRRSYLTESVSNIGKDVDFLYKAAGLDVFDGVLRREDPREIERFFSAKSGFIKGGPWYHTDSGVLKTKAAQQAHEIAPVSIHIGMIRSGSGYIPVRPLGASGRGNIDISINDSVVGAVQRELANSRFYKNSVVDRLKNSMGGRYNRFARELDAPNMKGIIAHELAHWIDDALHNRHIAKAVTAVMDKKAPLPFAHSVPGGSQHPVEIEAQVHAMREIKRSLGKRAFDKITWKDVYAYKPSIGLMLKTDRAGYMPFMKRFIKRLHREGLLGKGLREIVPYNEMQAVIWGL